MAQFSTRSQARLEAGCGPGRRASSRSKHRSEGGHWTSWGAVPYRGLSRTELMTEHETDLPDEIDEPQDVEVMDEEPAPRNDGADALKLSSSALTRRDPLGVYMRDVQRYALLSKEEEHDLAVRFFENDDLEAAKQLVTSNLRLVVKIAYDYRQAYKNILDLVQEGNIGLMQAVKKYDPYKGVKLSSYAAWWIRAYILRYILNNHRLVKVGTTQAQRKLFFNLQKEKARLSAMGIEPTAEMIAERLNVPERDVVSMDMRLAAGDASLDAPVGTGDGRTVARVELLPSDDVRVDDTLAEAEVGDQFTAKIHEFGASLEGKEKKIFEDRLVAEDPKTLQTLGDEFGVSRERVRQIEKRLLKKLKAFLHEELGETVVEVYESP
ncbi:MAG: RNA polymerase factor sigma-32 [Myxococcales bacterium]|nr:MAG: RNA polymerase factor sigma-32 [Myxococcales bacterium]